MSFNNKYCSPDKKGNQHTCFDMDSLIKIVEHYNKTLEPEDRIPLSKSKKKLWKRIQKKILSGYQDCQDDFCLLKDKKVQEIGDEKIMMETFIPEQPKEWLNNPRSWLSTLDINYALLQYQLKYPNFEYIGAVPIDFDHQLLGVCISEELCKLDVEKLLEKGKNKLGVVFNLDAHNQPGSHWVSMFADLETGGVHFIDSVGMPPKIEIKKLMDRVIYQGNNLLKDNKIDTDLFGRDDSLIYQVEPVSSKVLKLETTPPSYLETMLLEYWCADREKLFTNIIDRVKDNKIYLKYPLEKGCNLINIYGFKPIINHIPHQHKNTECGTYSIYFISKLIEGHNYQDLVHQIVDDDTMNSYRQYFFRPYKELK